MKLTKHEVINITYTKADKSSSDRTIIPVYVPPANVRAIDVSDMDNDTQTELLARLSEYETFKEQFYKLKLPSFDSWMGETHPKQPINNIKWRMFTPNGISKPK